MLIYEVLERDHVKVKGLLAKLVESSKAEESTRSELIDAIRDELIPHARAEEAVLYNSLRSIDGAQDLVRHGYVEHMEAEGLLRLLQTLDAAHVDWQKTAERLKASVEHHIEEEESEIFPAARAVLAEEEARLMADAFNELKPKIEEESFMKNTLDLVANLMPSRFAAPLRSFSNRV